MTYSQIIDRTAAQAAKLALQQRSKAQQKAAATVALQSAATALAACWGKDPQRLLTALSSSFEAAVARQTK